MHSFWRSCCCGVAWLAIASGVSAADYETAASYDRLRERVFALTPANVGLPDGDTGVLAVVMDSASAAAVTTLAATADGSTSLYFSTGGGRLGIGTFESVRKEAAQLLAMSEFARRTMAPAGSRSLPESGTVRLYIITADAVFGGAATEAELEGGAHPLSPLFQQAGRVMHAIQSVEQSQAPQ